MTDQRTHILTLSTRWGWRPDHPDSCSGESLHPSDCSPSIVSRVRPPPLASLANSFAKPASLEVLPSVLPVDSKQYQQVAEGTQQIVLGRTLVRIR